MQKKKVKAEAQAAQKQDEEAREEEEKKATEAHTKKVKAILDQLTAEEIQAQTKQANTIIPEVEMKSHQSKTLREDIIERPSARLTPRGVWERHLPEGEGKEGGAMLTKLQRCAATALAKQFCIPIAAAEAAATAVDLALVAAAAEV